MHTVKRLTGRTIPRFMDLAVTYRCQCRCVHCAATSQEGQHTKEMTTAELKSVIDQAARLGVLEVIFSGGEPLLRPDIVELVKHAHDAGLLIRLNTNGQLLNRQLIADLKKAGITQCAVSIDSTDPEVHDRLRGLPGLYEKAVAGIKMLREFGIPCQILTYAARENITAGLEKIIALGRELKVFAVFIFFPMAVGRWDDNFDQVLSEEERRKVRKLQDCTLVHLELPSRRSPCCAYAKVLLYVSAHGDVTPCPFVPLVIGNLGDHSLEELWRSYCADLNLECRGECPMNFPKERKAFTDHVASVARQLHSGDGGSHS